MHVTVSSNFDEFGFPFLTDFNRFLTVFSSLFLILNSKGFEGRDSHIAHFIIRSDLAASILVSFWVNYLSVVLLIATNQA